MLEVHVPQGVGVQVPLSALMKKPPFGGFFILNIH